MSVLESDLGAALCVAFPYRFPRLLIFRRTVINAETKAGWRARAGVKGQADYYVMGAQLHIEVETKAARGALRKEQAAWRARCAQLGIPYLVARALPGEAPAATVERWLNEIADLLSPLC